MPTRRTRGRDIGRVSRLTRFTARLACRDPGAVLVWAPFPADKKSFEPSNAAFMINSRVKDLRAMLAQLRAAGAAVDEKVQEASFGKFGWVMDPRMRPLGMIQASRELEMRQALPAFERGLGSSRIPPARGGLSCLSPRSRAGLDTLR